jgi:transposase
VAAQLVQLGDTLNCWSVEIVAMWRFTRNNGITEGFYNKMDLINRQAYGFRNSENYRLRVTVLCSLVTRDLGFAPVVDVEPVGGGG